MFCVLFNFTVSHISPQGHLKLPCGPIRKGPHWWETNPYREECSMGASMQPIRHCMGGTVCRASTPYWRGHNIGDIGQEVCAGQKVLTSVRTKGSPFSLVRFPLTFCVLLFATDSLPGSVPRKVGKQVRRSCKTLPPSRTTQLGSGVSALPSRLFYELVYSKDLCPLPSFSGAPCSPFPGRACFAGPHTRGIVTWLLESADGWLPPVMPAGTLIQPVGRGVVEFYFCMGGF
jgi:hypothetical protein